MPKTKIIFSIPHYLSLLGLSEYISKLEAAEIQISDIEELNHERLLEIGIEEEEIRNKILSFSVPCFHCTQTVSIYLQTCPFCNQILNRSPPRAAWITKLVLIFLGLLMGWFGHDSYLNFESMEEKDVVIEAQTETFLPIHPRMSKIRKQYPLYGIDVSKYQGKIDWKTLLKRRESDLPSFVFVRSTAGEDHKDIHFDRNWNELGKMDFIRRGAYHYYRPNENSTKQAQNFINNVSLRQGDLAPVLDIEVKSKVQSMESLRTGLKNWLTIIENQYNIRPIIYSSEKFYKAHIQGDPVLRTYPTWIASYSTTNLSERMNWNIWQVTAQGRIEGIKPQVDVNVVLDESTLEKLVLQ